MEGQNKSIIDKVDGGISRHIGSYSDAAAVKETGQAIWLFTSGTPGVDEAGRYPDNITAQSRQAWKNILKILAASKLSVNDIVKITATVTDPAYIEPYVASRKEILGDLKPALMLSVVKETFKPEILIEVEVIAYGVPNDRK
jgi:2-iminobutanoate/2-iminopropanoate deaminase